MWLTMLIQLTMESAKNLRWHLAWKKSSLLLFVQGHGRPLEMSLSADEVNTNLSAYSSH